MGGELLARNPQMAPVLKGTVRDPFLNFIAPRINMGGELLARNPAGNPQAVTVFKEKETDASDPFFDFLSPGNNEVSLDNIVANITTRPLRNNSAKEITVFAEKGPGDFERVRNIISENKAAFMQMSAQIMRRAQALQIACCPHGQNRAGSLSSGSVKADFLKVSSRDGLVSFNDSKSDKDHQHCPKCGVDMGANGCPQCAV